jgi:dihydrofolate reductase
MRKLVAGMFVSADGVVEAPEKWTVAYKHPEIDQTIGARFASSDAMLLGRRTYETFAAAFSGHTDPMSAQMNAMPKFVVSTTLKSADWENSTVIAGDVASEIKRLKQQPGKDIGISGSGTLVLWLLRNRLLDELQMLVPPIVVGSSKKLFDGGGELPLTLINCKTLSNGVLAVTYGPAPNGT